ncbi:MAG: hypothetical protein UD936_04680 [Acutalibacteraceae bacterium]|nr:hypothetical protein [Acutalibacteraceae bacterium]
MSGFVRADIGAFERFVVESEEAIKEFASIRNEFDRINNTLLSKWEGSGQVAYRNLADDITQRVGGIKDVLDIINDTIVKDVIDSYNKIDIELAEYNRNPPKDTESAQEG